MQPRFNDKWEHTDRLIQTSYQGDCCTLQFHPQIELYFVDEGEMDICIGDQRRLLSAGQLSVALSYDPHTYATPSKSRSSVLIVPVHLCEKFLTATKGLQPVCPFITDPQVYGQFKHYCALLEASAGQHLLEYGYLQVILGLLFAHLQFQKADALPDTDLITALLSYINQNYSAGISPSHVAAALGYSPGYLSRVFRARFGITLTQYITNVKLKNALSMLIEEKSSITDCALESGFTSVGSFYRVFRKEFGCAPGTYIKNTTGP